MKKILVSILILGLISLSGGLGVYQAEAVTSDLSVAMTAGSLAIASSATAALTGKTVSSAAQTSTGSIANVSATDERGSGAGWSATMTSTHFTTRVANKSLVDPAADAVTFTGTYDGLDGVLDPNGTFIVEITTAGTGTVAAVFKWTDPTGTETLSVTAAATVALSNGISVNFPDPLVATLAIGDKWSAGVDVFPYTGLTVTPGTITAASGSLTGVTAGSAEALAGTVATSDAKTLMIATINNGLGDYDQAPALSLSVHANSLAGSFAATATITIA